MTEARGVWARIELLGMLFAAGRGKRMRPLSDVMPKPALPVAGRPLAHLAVHNLRRAGVDEAHANTWHLADAMEARSWRTTATSSMWATSSPSSSSTTHAGPSPPWGSCAWPTGASLAA